MANPIDPTHYDSDDLEAWRRHHVTLALRHWAAWGNVLRVYRSTPTLDYARGYERAVQEIRTALGMPTMGDE